MNNNCVFTPEILAEPNEAPAPIQFYDEDLELGAEIDKKISKNKTETTIAGVGWTRTVGFQNGAVDEPPNRHHEHPEIITAECSDNAPVPATMDEKEKHDSFPKQKDTRKVIPLSTHIKSVENSNLGDHSHGDDRSSLKSFSSNSFAMNASGKGLAVACLVTDENKPIYEATEYNPPAKTQLHKSTRCRVYTAMSLLLTSTLVAVAVFFATKNIPVDTTTTPTLKPTTYRESTMQQMIEDNVLKRNVSFNNMKSGDPRLLALEWLLYEDKMHLSHDDSNMMQRYILALLAFSLDLYSWDCGMVNGLTSCNMTDYEGNDGSWLSRTDECMWWGVSCDERTVTRLDLCKYIITMNCLTIIFGMNGWNN